MEIRRYIRQNLWLAILRSKIQLELQEAIFSRRTVRKFKKDPVPREVVDQIIDAARYAPSACNLQLWEFIAVDDPNVGGRAPASMQFDVGHPRDSTASGPTE